MRETGMGTCGLCGRSSVVVSQVIGFCVECIRSRWEEVKPHIDKLHFLSRREFGLVEVPPEASDGIPCTLCSNRCFIPPGGRGYCGVWRNDDGRLMGPDGGALVSWYLDPIPTNCVAARLCAATGAGHGLYNLAVFYEACNFNCLYCQNWHYRRGNLAKGVPVEAMLRELNSKVFCICFFGGDPVPQAPFAFDFVKRSSGVGLRVCWETNGSGSPEVIRRMMELSLNTGGVLKVDLKAYSPSVHYALCGVNNRAVLENLRMLARLSQNAGYPALVVSTLLVPGYVDEEELALMAEFIASLDAEVPWVLLAFYPSFYLRDLPTTSRRHARRAVEIAKERGLKRVYLGNIHLLGDDY